jgi:hypothetical protein
MAEPAKNEQPATISVTTSRRTANTTALAADPVHVALVRLRGDQCPDEIRVTRVLSQGISAHVLGHSKIPGIEALLD